ncbi:hypothetical protein B0H10DRAFT_2236582 [Mycena sp. CBHHK59/15]|nr:hypothetical protein B0H10DRAFT_2236582 [Mycena sp. CBHHK59/15]
MAPRFTGVPTKHVVRPLLAAPSPVTLPVLLTNIIPEQFPLPRILTDIDSSRTPSPPPVLVAHLHPPVPVVRLPLHPHVDTDSRESSLTPMESDDNSSDSSLAAKKPNNKITRPSGANIQSVKSLFKERYPDLTTEEQDQRYTDFRTRLDELCARYLRPALALTYQDKDELNKVYKKMTNTLPWLAHYDSHWPVSVCLQTKLHNSASRAVDKSTRKAANMLAGVAPRGKSKTPRKHTKQ